MMRLQIGISLCTHTCFPRVISRECLLVNKVSCTAAHSAAFFTCLFAFGAGYRTLIDSAALLISALAALAARPARVVGRACFSMRSGPKGSGICSAMAAANFSRFFAIMMRSYCRYLQPFLPPWGGQGGRRTPPLSHYVVGNRACVAARPRNKTPPSNPLAGRGGLDGGVSGSLTAVQARCRAVQHEQKSQDMTGSACGFWRGLCVRAGSMLARRLCNTFWHGSSRGRVRSRRPAEAKPAWPAEPALDLSKEHMRTHAGYVDGI